MNYYRTCPVCGANLDPSEECDCITADPETTNNNFIDESEEKKNDSIR